MPCFRFVNDPPYLYNGQVHGSASAKCSTSDPFSATSPYLAVQLKLGQRSDDIVAVAVYASNDVVKTSANMSIYLSQDLEVSTGTFPHTSMAPIATHWQHATHARLSAAPLALGRGRPLIKGSSCLCRCLPRLPLAGPQFYDAPNAVLCAENVSLTDTASPSLSPTNVKVGWRKLALCNQTLPAVRYITIVYFRRTGTLFSLGEVQVCECPTGWTIPVPQPRACNCVLWLADTRHHRQYTPDPIPASITYRAPGGAYLGGVVHTCSRLGLGHC